MHKTRQPRGHPAPRPLLANKDVNATIKVARARGQVPAENVFLDPVYLKVAKGDAVPRSNDGERVPLLEHAFKEAGLVLAPELADSGCRHPRLEELHVCQSGQVNMFLGLGSNGAQVGHWLRRRRGNPQRQVSSNTGHKARIENLPHPMGFRPHRVSNAICKGVLQRRRRKVGREMRRRVKGPQGHGMRRRNARGHRPARQVVVQAREAVHGRVQAHGRLAVDGRAGTTSHRRSRHGREGPVVGLQREEEQVTWDLPEHALRDKHARPLVAAVVGARSARSVCRGNQAHALQLRDQVAAAQHAVALDIDAPLAFGFRVVGRVSGGDDIELGARLGLVEVPVQRHPHHHGDLARGAGGGLEVGVGRVRDGRDEERVAVQRRAHKGTHAGFCPRRRRPRRSALVAVVVVFVVVAVAEVDAVCLVGIAAAAALVGLKGRLDLFFGVQHDVPADGEGVGVHVHLVALEAEAGEDGHDGEGLAIGQMQQLRRHGLCLLWVYNAEDEKRGRCQWAQSVYRCSAGWNRGRYSSSISDRGWCL